MIMDLISRLVGVHQVREFLFVSVNFVIHCTVLVFSLRSKHFRGVLCGFHFVTARLLGRDRSVPVFARSHGEKRETSQGNVCFAGKSCP